MKYKFIFYLIFFLVLNQLCSLTADAEYKKLSGNKIPELSHVLQQRVRDSVRESLGLDEIRNITIKVQEIIGEPTKGESTDQQAIDG